MTPKTEESRKTPPGRSGRTDHRRPGRRGRRRRARRPRRGLLPGADRRTARRPGPRHRRPLERGRLAHRPPHRPVPQGRRPRHRRHLDDARAGTGVREGPRPPRRVRRRRPPGPRPDDEPSLDPRTGGRGAPAPADLPRREVARGAAPLRPRRPPRGRCRATSSTAVPRCTWPRSAWSTRPTRRARTPRRSTSRAPTSPRTGGRRPGSSRLPSQRPVHRGRRPTRSSTPPGPGQGRHPDRHRGRLRSGRRAQRLRDGTRAAAGGGGTFRHRRPGLPQPSLGARRPSRLHSIEELPVALGMLLVGGRRLPAHGAGFGELRPRLRLHRHDERRDRRCPGLRGAVRDWAKRSRRRAASICTPPPGRSTVTREVFADRERRRARPFARERCSPAAPEPRPVRPPDLGAARGPRRP